MLNLGEFFKAFHHFGGRLLWKSRLVKLEFRRKMYHEKYRNIFAKNPHTPPETTEDMSYEERKSNWEKRINKAKEQSEIKPIPYSQVLMYVNDFLNILLNSAAEFNNKSPYILSLDKNNEAVILDKGMIVQISDSWESP